MYVALQNTKYLLSDPLKEKFVHPWLAVSEQSIGLQCVIVIVV